MIHKCLITKPASSEEVSTLVYSQILKQFMNLHEVWPIIPKLNSNVPIVYQTLYYYYTCKNVNPRDVYEVKRLLV